MDLLNFLNYLSPAHFTYKKNVLCFYGLEEGPLLFFSFFLRYLRTTHIKVEVINVAELGLDSFLPRLHSSFLGESVFYWLGDIYQVSEKDRAKFYTVIKDYVGPHTIAFFSGTRCESTTEYGVQLP